MEKSTLTVAPAQKNASRESTRLIIRRIDDFLRRLLDIFLSIIGMLLLSPLFFLIAVAIKQSSPGPIFYWGPRAGKDGRSFKILKFRTMFERAQSYQGPKVTAENDPRITPLGRMLRQTKLNELPQFWNVLKGDMSLVGPRPEDPTIASAWPEDVREEILSVKPGITSPASVVYRNEEEMLHSKNLMDTYLWDILPTKLRLDQLYVRNRSILTDFDVLFWTAVGLLPRLKTYAVPEHLLYWGPMARFTERFLSWFLIDFLVAFGAVGAAGVISRLYAPLDLGVQLAVLIALAIAFLFSLFNWFAGLNRVNWARARVQDAFGLAASNAIVIGLLFVANLYFPPRLYLPAGLILLTGLFAFTGFVVTRYRSQMFSWMLNRSSVLNRRGMQSLGEHVLIVGAGEVGRFATWLMRNDTFQKAFNVVGMVDDNPRKVGTKIDGCTIIGTTSSIGELVAKHDIGLILYAIADIDPTNQERILSACQDTPARIIPIPDIIENLQALFPKNETERDRLFNKVLKNATTDRLTNAFNRHQFLRLAQAEVQRATRYSHPMAVVMIAIEYSRPIESPFSTIMLTKVVKHASVKCLENLRGIDMLGRYRSNILAVLLPETDDEAVPLVVERLKSAITGERLITDRGPVTPMADFRVITNFCEVPHEQIENVFDHLAFEMTGTKSNARKMQAENNKL